MNPGWASARLGAPTRVTAGPIQRPRRKPLGLAPRSTRSLPRKRQDHIAVALRSASGAIVPVPCGEEPLDIVQHQAVVIRLGEGGGLLAGVASLFGGCRDCSGRT